MVQYQAADAYISDNFCNILFIYLKAYLTVAKIQFVSLKTRLMWSCDGKLGILSTPRSPSQALSWNAFLPVWQSKYSSLFRVSGWILLAIYQTTVPYYQGSFCKPWHPLMLCITFLNLASVSPNIITIIKYTSERLNFFLHQKQHWPHHRALEDATCYLRSTSRDAFDMCSFLCLN